MSSEDLCCDYIVMSYTVYVLDEDGGICSFYDHSLPKLSNTDYRLKKERKFCFNV